MKSLQFITTLLILFTNITFSQSETPETKAIAVIEKSIVAMGGKDFLKSIKTLYSDSETQMDGRNVNWITKEMLPNKGAFDITFEGRTVYKSWYDGKTGYEFVRGEKKKANQENYSDKKYRKNIFNELDYLDRSLYKIKYIGEESINGKICVKIETLLANGQIKYVYYDKTTYLLTKEETVRNGAKDSFSIVYFEDYKNFDGLTYFTKMKLQSDSGTQIATIVDLYYNKGITESDFK